MSQKIYATINVNKSFEDHKGRPGEIGGSQPRSGSNGKKRTPEQEAKHRAYLEKRRARRAARIAARSGQPKKPKVITQPKVQEPAVQEPKVPAQQPAASEPSDLALVERMSSYVRDYQQIKYDRENVRATRAMMVSAERKYWRTHNAYDKQRYEHLQQSYDTDSAALTIKNREFRDKYPDEIKAPGFGQWQKVQLAPGSTPVAGHASGYEVPGHPEYGHLEVYHFGGWSMQRVAARSSVEWNGFKLGEWSGSGAQQKAEKYAKKVFGERRYRS